MMILKKIEEELKENRFGFRQGIGTREAILTLRLLTERRLKINRNTFITYLFRKTL